MTCRDCKELQARLTDVTRERNQAEARLDRVLKQLSQVDSYLLRNTKRAPDHACKQCVPNGPIVDPDFTCAFHAAEARAAGKLA